MSENFNCDENLEEVSDNNSFMFELLKAERDKCLIETIKECALHPDKPIEITKQVIKLNGQELEEVFDKVNMAEEDRTIYRDVYFNKGLNQ